MCLKEVDLKIIRKCHPEDLADAEENAPDQIPTLSSESVPTKDAWRTITEKERISVAHKSSSDTQQARITVDEQKNQEIQKFCRELAKVDKRDTEVLSSVVKLIIILLLPFGTVCRAEGSSFLGTDFPPDILLNCHVPPFEFGRAKWFCGQKAMRNVAENENLIIGHQDFKNYACEMSLPNADPVMVYFPMPAFNTCTIMENEDFAAFKRGDKCMQVTLEGKQVPGSDSGFVTQQYYIFCIRNFTLEMSPKKGSGYLQLTSIRCNVKFEDMNPHVNGGTAEVLDVGTTEVDEKFKKVIVSLLVVAAIAASALIGLCIWCGMCGIIRLRMNRLARDLKAKYATDSAENSFGISNVVIVFSSI